ncbi:MAG: MarR family transcriptional regulator [Steroidobacteraceae bacterium]
MQVGRLIKLVLASLLRSVDARMQPLALTAMQWEPLLVLALGRADTVAALARECSMDCGAMTRMLDRLEHKQLLQRQRSHSDRRVVNLVLTPTGREAADRIPLIVRQELDLHLAGFTADELQQLTGFLTRMLRNAEGSAAQEAIE